MGATHRGRTGAEGLASWGAKTEVTQSRETGLVLFPNFKSKRSQKSRVDNFFFLFLAVHLLLEQQDDDDDALSRET
jgi:hypothetical protein